MKFTTTGKSIKELLDIYGTGASGFYPQTWYHDEEFLDEKPEAGEYEIEFDSKYEALDRNKTYSEQLSLLKEGYKPIHPAILCEAILVHYELKGVRLLSNSYSGTSSLTSDGDRVLVGRFDAEGLFVRYWGDDSRRDDLGLSAARKLPLKSGKLDPFESLPSLRTDLEARVVVLEKQMEKIRKFLII